MLLVRYSEYVLDCDRQLGAGGLELFGLNGLLMLCTSLNFRSWFSSWLFFSIDLEFCFSDFDFIDSCNWFSFCSLNYKIILKLYKARFLLKFLNYSVLRELSTVLNSSSLTGWTENSMADFFDESNSILLGSSFLITGKSSLLVFWVYFWESWSVFSFIFFSWDFVFSNTFVLFCLIILEFSSFLVFAFVTFCSLISLF